MTGCMPKIDRWIELAPFMPARRAATSSSRMRRLGDAEPVAAVLLGRW